MYQNLIHELTALNPAGVEAHMRAEYGTLDHLPRGKFLSEALIAGDCEKECPGYLKMIADSMGLGADFKKWEAA